MDRIKVKAQRLRDSIEIEEVQIETIFKLNDMIPTMIPAPIPKSQEITNYTHTRFEHLCIGPLIYLSLALTHINFDFCWCSMPLCERQMNDREEKRERESE